MRLYLPLKKSKQESGNEECVSAYNETLTNGDYAPQNHLYAARLMSVHTPLHNSEFTYGIQLSGPIFLLISCEGSSAVRNET
jgi:hypothetical protein